MEFKRKDFLQNAGTLIALVISIIAMATSIYEANILKAQQKSMVWPYLSVSTSYSKTGFSAEAFNNGTGPAIVKSMEVSVDDMPVETMLDLVKVLMPQSNLGYANRRSIITFLGQVKRSKLSGLLGPTKPEN